MGAGIETLRGVTIRRYRGIDRMDLPLRPMTMLVGRNSVGKSNILQALGHEPFAAGEEERADDPPPQLTWIHTAPAELSDRRWLALQLENLGAGADAAEEVAHLLLRQAEPLMWSRDAETLIGLSRLDIDRLELLRCISDHEVPRLGWLDELLGPPAHGGHLFVPVGAVTTESPLPVIMPKTVYVDSDDITEHLTRRVRQVMRTCLGALAQVDHEVDEALTACDEGRLGPVRELGLLGPILARLEADANALAPVFLKEHGQIRISLNSGPDDTAGRIRQLLVDARAGLDTTTEQGNEPSSLIEEALRLVGEHGDTFDLHLDSQLIEASTPGTPRPYSRLGQGSRRWIAASLIEAADRLESHVRRDLAFAEPDTVRAAVLALDSASSPTEPGAPGLRLLDEPGESLHPTAQRDVLAWLEDRVSEGDLVVFSAHQPAMLHSVTDPDDVVVIGVHRSDGQSVPTYMPGALIEELESNTVELGITRTELLLQARGLLLVEGGDDAAVLQRLYGDELARRSIVMHAVGGSNRRSVVDLLESPLFRLLDVPVWIMFDRTAGQPDEEVPSSESRAIELILRHCEDDDFPSVRAVPFEPPDVICGFRPGLVREVFPGMLSQTWPKTVEAWERASSAAEGSAPSFKTWLMGRAGLRRGASFSQVVIEPLLAAATGGPADASEWLRTAMRHLFDDLLHDGSGESST